MALTQCENTMNNIRIKYVQIMVPKTTEETREGLKKLTKNKFLPIVFIVVSVKSMCIMGCWRLCASCRHCKRPNVSRLHLFLLEVDKKVESYNGILNTDKCRKMPSQSHTCADSELHPRGLHNLVTHD